MPKFGPGKLTIGETAGAIDASCLVNSLKITASKDESDGKTMLCGTVKPGKVTYTYTLTGNVDTDTDDPAGLFALCAANPGTVVPFTFTPSQDGETEASGRLVLDPLDFGGDEYGDDMASDLEFSLVGAPVYTYGEDGDARQERRAAAFAPLVVNGKPDPGAAAPASSSPDTDSSSTSSADSELETATR
jgi:hypothetical protein